MDSVEDGSIPSTEAIETAQSSAVNLISDAMKANRKLPKATKSLEITSRTIKTPAFSYACLELISDPSSKIPLDNLTVRSYLTSAFSQFLGLTGSAISVDILKVEPKECWIRVPREDLSSVIAAVGGWIGHGENSVEVGWRVRASGNWLGSLVGGRSAEKVWTR
jgi:ribonuclease P/MRP protein subunit POP8